MTKTKFEYTLDGVRKIAKVAQLNADQVLKENKLDPEKTTLVMVSNGRRIEYLSYPQRTQNLRLDGRAFETKERVTEQKTEK